MSDLTHDAGRGDEIKAEQRQKALARADADVLRKIMLSRNGRDWLWRLLDWCDVYSEPFVPGVDGERETCRNLGRQMVGKRLNMEVMEASQDLYITMLREAREAEQMARQEKRAAEKREAKQEDVLEPEDMPEGSVDLPAPAPLDLPRSL